MRGSVRTQDVAYHHTTLNIPPDNTTRRSARHIRPAHALDAAFTSTMACTSKCALLRGVAAYSSLDAADASLPPQRLYRKALARSMPPM